MAEKLVLRAIFLRFFALYGCRCPSQDAKLVVLKGYRSDYPEWKQLRVKKIAHPRYPPPHVHSFPQAGGSCNRCWASKPMRTFHKGGWRSHPVPAKWSAPSNLPCSSCQSCTREFSRLRHSHWPWCYGFRQRYTWWSSCSRHLDRCTRFATASHSADRYPTTWHRPYLNKRHCSHKCQTYTIFKSLNHPTI